MESWIHEKNCRYPKYELVLHYLKEMSAATIKSYWRKLRAKMNKAGIIFAAAIEITRGKNGKPCNRVHYHILVDSSLNREELRKTMKTICTKSGIGIEQVDFTLNFTSQFDITWGLKKIHYFTKFNHADKVILFEKGLRIQKFYYSKNWFINSDGTTTTKTKIRTRLLSDYKRSKSTP